jgi:hypothetical protein
MVFREDSEIEILSLVRYECRYCGEKGGFGRTEGEARILSGVIAKYQNVP